MDEVVQPVSNAHINSVWKPCRTCRQLLDEGGGDGSHFDARGPDAGAKVYRFEPILALLCHQHASRHHLLDLPSRSAVPVSGSHWDCMLMAWCPVGGKPGAHILYAQQHSSMH